MNMVLSISHDPSTGLTSALLLGCSEAQQAFIHSQLKAYSDSSLASHPLLLPVLFTAYQRSLLGRHTEKLWSTLIEVETMSGQTGAPAIHIVAPTEEPKDYNSIVKDILGVIQLASSWESYMKILLEGIESIQESIDYVSKLTPVSREGATKATAAILTERLRFLSHKSKVMLWDFEYFNKRAQAQMTAVSGLHTTFGRHVADNARSITI